MVNKRGSLLRNQAGLKLMAIVLHKCHIEGCKAQTSNRYCAKCVAKILEKREELVYHSTNEFLDKHDDATVREATMIAEFEDHIINGITDNTAIPIGLLGAK